MLNLIRGQQYILTPNGSLKVSWNDRDYAVLNIKVPFQEALEALAKKQERLVGMVHFSNFENGSNRKATIYHIADDGILRCDVYSENQKSNPDSHQVMASELVNLFDKVLYLLLAPKTKLLTAL